MKHMYCAGSVPTRSASRLAHLTAELSTTQVPNNCSLQPFVRYLGDTPYHGSFPQSRASEYCTAVLNYSLGGGTQGLPPGNLGFIVSAMLSSSSAAGE